MSNLAFVVAFIVFALGGVGLTALVASISLNNKFKREIAELEAELGLSKENHIRNGQIAKEYQVLCGDLQEKIEALEARNAFLETSAANGWKDAADKWQQLVDLRNK